MNIESILNKIHLFDELVIKSGLKRDINDFIQAIQQAQNRNLVFMKGLSESLKEHFITLQNNSLESELRLILKDTEPFTDLNIISQLDDLDANNEIDANNYFQKFNNLLHQLKQRVDSNDVELKEARALLVKYVTDQNAYAENEEQALMSLIFKDLKSTGSLHEFSRVLHRWNRTLIVYHTLLKSDSPNDISLVEIQNGSIDVIFNINFDVAVDLTELITVGLKVYGAYLLYKSKRAKEIIESYMGNKKLIKLEEEREVLMLENIKDSVKNKILEQHKNRLKTDKKIDKTGVDKKADEVSSVITDHIIKGNEVKLLTPPQNDDEESETNLSTELREETAIVRERFKKLDKKDILLLLEKYSIKEEQLI